jgi:hypothetical protein
MKKLWMMLIALVLLTATLPVFAADVGFGGRMIWAANINADGEASGVLVRFRPNFTVKVDEFNTLFVEMRTADSLAFDTASDFWLHDAKLTTDLTGALKLDLPFTLKTIVGLFEPGFTDWNYVSESGWENYYDWPNKLADWGPFHAGGIQLDLAVKQLPVVLHYFTDFPGDLMMIGLSGGYGPVVGWLTFQLGSSVPGDGILGIEAKYTGEFGGFKVGVPVFFRYELNAPATDQDFTYGAGVSGDYSMFHLAAGLEGDSENALDNVVVDLAVKPLDPLKVYGHLYLDMGKDYSYTTKYLGLNYTTSNAVTSELTGVDIGVSYKFGAPTFMVGYVIAGADENRIPINGDTFAITSGLYIAVDLSY